MTPLKIHFLLWAWPRDDGDRIFVLVDTVASTIQVEITVRTDSGHGNSTKIGFESEQEGVSEIPPFMYEHWLQTVSQWSDEPVFSIRTCKAVGYSQASIVFT